MLSPANSTRIGNTFPAGNRSTTPPRVQNSPCASTGSLRTNPAFAKRSANAVGNNVAPVPNSTTAVWILFGSLTRGRSAAADATTSRARPLAIATSARARADATSKCGAIPRYGSTSSDGKGKTQRSTSMLVRLLAALTKKRASCVIRSTSVSDGTISTSGLIPENIETAKA